jgi:hypothetical protein
MRENQSLNNELKATQEHLIKFELEMKKNSNMDAADMTEEI